MCITSIICVRGVIASAMRATYSASLGTGVGKRTCLQHDAVAHRAMLQAFCMRG